VEFLARAAVGVDITLLAFLLVQAAAQAVAAQKTGRVALGWAAKEIAAEIQAHGAETILAVVAAAQRHLGKRRHQRDQTAAMAALELQLAFQGHH
jgi:hypothetical protein